MKLKSEKEIFEKYSGDFSDSLFRLAYLFTLKFAEQEVYHKNTDRKIPEALITITFFMLLYQYNFYRSDLGDEYFEYVYEGSKDLLIYNLVNELRSLGSTDLDLSLNIINRIRFYEDCYIKEKDEYQLESQKREICDPITYFTFYNTDSQISNTIDLMVYNNLDLIEVLKMQANIYAYRKNFLLLCNKVVPELWRTHIDNGL